MSQVPSSQSPNWKVAAATSLPTPVINAVGSTLDFYIALQYQQVAQEVKFANMAEMDRRREVAISNKFEAIGGSEGKAEGLRLNTISSSFNPPLQENRFSTMS